MAVVQDTALASGTTLGQRFLRTGLYPLLFLGALPFYLLLTGKLGLHFEVAVMGTVAAFTGSLIVVEFYTGVYSRNRRDRPRGTLDVYYMALGGVQSALIAAVYVPAGAWLGRHLGIDFAARLTSHWLDVALAIVLMDFGAYWMHRWEHRTESSLLWRSHSVHHGLSILDVVAGGQVHFIDGALAATPLLLVAAMGFSPMACGAAFSLYLVAAGLHHTDLPIDLGWFNYVTIAPESHRWHHVDRWNETVNYGFVFAIWDLSFGTFRLPSATEHPAYGASSLERFPDTLRGQLLVGMTDRTYRRLVKAHPRKTIVITGAANGLGLDLARVASEEGHDVYGLDCAPFPELPGGVTGLQCDLRKAESREAALNEILKRSGRVDVLINNAAMGAVTPLEHLSSDWIADCVAVNLTAPLALTRDLVPHMRERGSGRIVNVSSISSLVSVPGTAVYAASKAGLERGSRILVAELTHCGVSVGVARLGRMPTGAYRRVTETVRERLSNGGYPGYAAIQDLFWAVAGDQAAGLAPRQVARRLLAFAEGTEADITIAPLSERLQIGVAVLLPPAVFQGLLRFAGRSAASPQIAPEA